MRTLDPWQKCILQGYYDFERILFSGDMHLEYSKYEVIELLWWRFFSPSSSFSESISEPYTACWRLKVYCLETFSPVFDRICSRAKLLFSRITWHISFDGRKSSTVAPAIQSWIKTRQVRGCLNCLLKVLLTAGGRIGILFAFRANSARMCKSNRHHGHKSNRLTICFSSRCISKC